jgi:hypothetical protein
MIFAWMPWVFMFLLGQFASGLVLYWIANNVLTFAQQYIIMRSQGIEVDLLGNIKSGIKPRRDKAKAAKTAAGETKTGEIGATDQAESAEGAAGTPVDEPEGGETDAAPPAAEPKPTTKPPSKPSSKPGRKSGSRSGAKASGRSGQRGGRKRSGGRG